MYLVECPCAHLTSCLWLDRMSVASLDFNHNQDPPASQPQVAPGGTQLARVVRVLGHIGPKVLKLSEERLTVINQ